MNINILHTNDIHSSFENFSRLVSRIKEFDRDNTIILDAGDFADFKRIELQGTDGLAALDLLQYAGYDAIAVGNNETFNGVDTLINMAVNSKIPFLSCNLKDLQHCDVPGVRRSTIIEKCGLRILIMGASPDLGEFNALNGIEVTEYMKAVKDEIELNRGGFDFCILLSHLGMDKDRKIAEEIEDINVIIGGHFHILMDKPEIIRGKIIHTSGSYAEHLGMLKLSIEEGKVSLLQSENIKTSEYDSCIDVLNILKENKDKAVDNLSNPLYHIDRDLWHDVIEENPMTNLLADALADVLQCDIGIINSGVLNGGIRKGPVSDKKLIDLCPSPLNPTHFEIQGKYIREALQSSMDSEVCYRDGKGPGFRGKYLGRLHVSNAVVEHNGRKVTRIVVNDEELEDDRWYSAATSDYLHRGTGYPALKNNRNVVYNKDYLRDILREYLQRKDFVEEALKDRWVLK